jgi:hypothetical protein
VIEFNTTNNLDLVYVVLQSSEGTTLSNYGQPLQISGVLFSKLKETRHRDKYLRIKVRYSGKDLAVI